MEKKQRGHQVQVLQAQPESEDVLSIYMDKPRDENFANWKPGQYAVVRMKQQEGQLSQPRPFTLSCAPEEGHLRLTVKRIGDFTSTLHSVQSGDELVVDGPFGSFCSDVHNQQRLLFISGGVGITPFLSVLRHFQETGVRKQIVLICAFRTRADIVAWAELQELVNALDMHLVIVLSREKELPAADKNFIHWESGHISLELLQRHADLQQSAIYVCGPGAMQEKVLQELEQAGIDKDLVRTEKFGG